MDTPPFLFLTERNREAFETVRRSLTDGGGLALLTGEPGTGKTTILNAVLSRCGRQGPYGRPLPPPLTPDDLGEYLASAAALDGMGPAVLAVDEAQHLSDDLLEQLRATAGARAGFDGGPKIVLAALPALVARLEARGLSEAFGVRAELLPFDLADTARYLRLRIRAEREEPTAVFSREAVEHIHRYSRGIPRLINIICDNALLEARKLNLQPVTRDWIEAVCRTLDLDA